MKNFSKGYVSLQKKISVLTLWKFTFLHSLTIASAGGSPKQYTPHDNVALDCGSTDNNTDLAGRSWIADNTIDLESAILSSLTKGDSIPYGTARLSRSQFTYSFTVTPGPKFIRLHFYPTSYQEFSRSNALFDVHIGRYTLLRSFRPDLTADYVKSEVFLKEFCVNVDDQNLTIVFTANPDVPDSYAFVNGIEIVSMPSNLYYSTDNDTGFKSVNQVNPYRILNNQALESVYRLNVGGSSISPAQDTGMYRSWSQDVEYLTKAEPSALPVGIGIYLSSSVIPSYSAPIPVYETARTMGTNKTVNENYRLTWEFRVDSGFTYFVRLHFCEFQVEITEPGDRVFQIYIDNIVAENQADVISWAGGKGVPVYRDYAVIIGRAGNERKRNLSIALHPAPEWRTKYSDAILNGVEIFKLSNEGNLAGPNPELLVAPPPPPELSNSAGGKSKTKRRVLIACIGCAVSLFTLLSLLACVVVWRHKKRQYGSYMESNWFCWWINPSKRKSTKFSSLPEGLCLRFHLDEIKAATNNFDDDLVVGKGGFGKVFKGFLDEGGKTVAIKRLNHESRQGVTEFLREIEMLSQLRHVHLVSSIGYCSENREMILVYDFMSNGTLSDHLHSTAYVPMTWKQRLEICKGAATGLNYLHTEVKHTVIHRDVKTSNILLDDKFTAKVSDFGLSKTYTKVDMLNSGVKGTWGYLDPAYARGHPLTDKSDVYSFGVVLFEVLCARKALDKKLPADQVNLAHWATKCIADGTLYQMIDPHLIGKIAPECFKVFVEIAENCIAELRTSRPSMNDVMEKLRFAIELQQAADAEKDKINPGGEHRYPDIVFPVARDDLDYESELVSELDFNTNSGIGILDSNTTGMTYSTIGSTTLFDMFSRNDKTTSIGN